LNIIDSTERIENAFPEEISQQDKQNILQMMRNEQETIVSTERQTESEKERVEVWPTKVSKVTIGKKNLKALGISGIIDSTKNMFEQDSYRPIQAKLQSFVNNKINVDLDSIMF
jgi:hypothetical protein